MVVINTIAWISSKSFQSLGLLSSTDILAHTSKKYKGRNQLLIAVLIGARNLESITVLIGARNLESIYKWSLDFQPSAQGRMIFCAYKTQNHVYLWVGKSPWKKISSRSFLSQMEKLRLNEENGIFKALQYISGRAGRWSPSRPVVCLFGVWFLILLESAESTPSLTHALWTLVHGIRKLYSAHIDWCLQHSLAAVHLLGKRTELDTRCALGDWNDKRWNVLSVYYMLSSILSASLSLSLSLFLSHTRICIYLMFPTNLKRWCTYWVLNASFQN